MTENKIPNLPPSPIETFEHNDVNLPKLIIRSPSYNAHLNAIKLASELTSEKVVFGSYNSPSLKSGDDHSDLEATSPKLKFGNVNITEYIPLSPTYSPDIFNIQEPDIKNIQEPDIKNIQEPDIKNYNVDKSHNN